MFTARKLNRQHNSNREIVVSPVWKRDWAQYLPNRAFLLRSCLKQVWKGIQAHQIIKARLPPEKISQGWTPKRCQWSGGNVVSFCSTSQVSPHLSASVGNVSRKKLLHSAFGGKEHLTQAPEAAKSPGSVAIPEEPFTAPCRFPELDGSRKTSREEEAKQSSAKHKKRNLRSLQSPSLRFSLCSEGTKNWMPQYTRSALCEEEPASQRPFFNFSSSFLQPGDDLDSTSLPLFLAGK